MRHLGHSAVEHFRLWNTFSWNTLYQLSIHRAPELLFRGTLFRCFALFSGCQSVIRNLEHSVIVIWATKTSGATQALFRSSASPFLRCSVWMLIRCSDNLTICRLAIRALGHSDNSDTQALGTRHSDTRHSVTPKLSQSDTPKLRL